MMVATILEPDLAGAARAIKEAEPYADAFEIRFDAFQTRPSAQDVRRLTKKPLIATCRRAKDGGAFQGNEAERARVLDEALTAVFDYVDMETVLPILMPEDRVVRSYHDFEGNPGPDEIVRRAREIGRKGAHIKFAVKCASFTDQVQLLQTMRRLRGEGYPATVLGLGEFPRALAHVFGSEFVYGGVRANAPGQPALRDVRHTLQHWGNPSPQPHMYLVVGDPIDHSLSPRLHNAAFRSLALEAAYGALRVRTGDELRTLLASPKDLGLAGLSVTTPLKAAAFSLITQRTDAAKAARAVNCVRIDGHQLVGHNTDGQGARAVLERVLGPPRKTSRVLLMGSGDAARAFLTSCRDYNLDLSGRNPQTLAAVGAEFHADVLSSDKAAAALSGYTALINATTEPDPIPLRAFSGALFDTHYGSEPTAWEKVAKARGLKFAGGRELLLAQAIPAFEFWTKRPAPIEVMRKAIGGAA